MEQTPITPRSCELGDELRTLRAKFSNGHEFASLLDWDPSKVSNIERGKVRPTDLDLAQYLTACGKGRGRVAEFSDFYRTAFDLYFAQAASNFKTICFAEASASTITGFGNATLPVLLRTTEYTEKLLIQRGATPEQIKDAVRSQQERQRVLGSAYQPEVLFYVTERSLVAPLDEARGRMDQLELLKRNSRFVRVIPDGERTPFSTEFTVYEHKKVPATAFVDCEFAKVFVQDATAVAQCRAFLAALDTISLSQADSKELLSRLLTEDYVAVIKTATEERPSTD
ncbi:Scr1 family TA system antitoxin-like transcriptional regulator [Lentzea sp. NPDC034063]|uniref:Scr1 family TA system antitoxin-like transcriptional regulator n=1 Tax=unclassified Lentzea TaxID=2643253 RepID=UPI0033E9E1D5